MRNLRAFALFIVAPAAAVLLSAAPAPAQDCPGNPKALGTSRVLAIDPREYPRVGLMQYHETLPLADKEVVLTFDDGPLPPYSDQILDILATECVKATYFLIGRMAHEFPATVRRIYEAGHTIGTHSEDHPCRFQNLPVEKVRREIDEGIADVGAALGDPKKLAPFFRIPGLARTDTIEKELAARSLVVFSSDAVADDWFHRIKPSEIIRRAMSRLEERGKGILLLHDIHPATVAALPGLLKELKEQGFHIVHVVPAAAGRMETAGEPAPLTTAWMTPWIGDRTDPIWPKVVAGQTADRIVLPAPDVSSFDTGYQPGPRVMLADGSGGAGMLAVASADTQWPDRSTFTLPSAEAELPAPSMQDLGIPVEELQVTSKSLGLRSSLAVSDPGEPGAAPSRN